MVVDLVDVVNLWKFDVVRTYFKAECKLYTYIKFHTLNLKVSQLNI